MKGMFILLFVSVHAFAVQGTNLNDNWGVRDETTVIINTPFDDSELVRAVLGEGKLPENGSLTQLKNETKTHQTQNLKPKTEKVAIAELAEKPQLPAVTQEANPSLANMIVGQSAWILWLFLACALYFGFAIAFRDKA